MKKLVPKVWVLVPGDDQDSRYFYGGSCPDLNSSGKLTVDTVVEILPLATHPYHNGVFIEKPFWYEGPEVSYAPRRLFFNELGFVIKRKRDEYGNVVLSILYGVTEKHPGTRTLAIIFPNEVVLEDKEAQDIVHIIQKTFVADCQTPKGQPDEKLSCVESIYLIAPPNATGQSQAAIQLLDAFVKE